MKVSQARAIRQFIVKNCYLDPKVRNVESKARNASRDIMRALNNKVEDACGEPRQLKNFDDLELNCKNFGTDKDFYAGKKDSDESQLAIALASVFEKVKRHLCTVDESDREVYKLRDGREVSFEWGFGGDTRFCVNGVTMDAFAKCEIDGNFYKAWSPEAPESDDMRSLYAWRDRILLEL